MYDSLLSWLTVAVTWKHFLLFGQLSVWQFPLHSFCCLPVSCIVNTRGQEEWRPVQLAFVSHSRKGGAGIVEDRNQIWFFFFFSSDDELGFKTRSSSCVKFFSHWATCASLQNRNKKVLQLPHATVFYFPVLTNIILSSKLMFCLVFSLFRAIEFCQWTSSIRNQHNIVITYFSHVQGSLVLTDAVHLVRLEKRRGLSKRLMYYNTKKSLSSTPVLTPDFIWQLLHPVLHGLVDRKKRHSGFSTISLKITFLNSVNKFSKIIFFSHFL